ncbi:unnamed protein product [Heligmosomoides polygyrus]|uniref:LITAF domain-containing protein n=1 Tax=Heligmosomoides polygyrus TaxID=6339 RepID=A0A183GB91_HELPZ|nr:unnamed protein product [Heligmosomoides polygyrus]
MSAPPPPYPGSTEGNDVTLKDDTVVAQKAVNSRVSNQSTVEKVPLTSPSVEMSALPPASRVPDTPLSYATAPNTPHLAQRQMNVPYAAHSAPSLNTAVNGGMFGAGMAQCAASPQSLPVGGQCAAPPPSVPMGAQCAASPQSLPMGYGGAPAVASGMQVYPGMMPMQPMLVQPAAMGMNPMQQPGALGAAPAQNGGINLVVNTNANSGSNSDSNGGNAGARPAPRPCPKCRLGYITRGQARFREMAIKALAYATVCCTCFLPLQLLKTNYVDKCCYCGEEYGFRGELFEKPKPPKT